MEAGDSSNERAQGDGLNVPDLLEARWQHWRVSVETAGAGTLVANVPPENLLLVLGDARGLDGPGYSRLVDLTAVDHGVEASMPRFELVYWLSRPGGGDSLRVRVALGTESKTKPGAEPARVPEAEPGAVLGIDSIVSLWPSANWLEREVFDLFGITFRGHPDLRRLLLPSDFEGAPLRKDYPRQPELPLPKALEALEALEPLESLEVKESPEAPEVAEVSEAAEAQEAGSL